MLVIPGYIEKGQFIPDNPALMADGVQAILTVHDQRVITVEENHRAWGEFLDAIDNIKDEELSGMP
jgi:hypothetical protein